VILVAEKLGKGGAPAPGSPQALNKRAAGRQTTFWRARFRPSARSSPSPRPPQASTC
jgi:hypothetical protein